MAVETTSVALTNAAYVALSASDASVTVRCNDSPLRLFVGTSLPAVGIDTWYPLDPNEEIHFEGLSTENVYALSVNATGTARIIRA